MLNPSAWKVQGDAIRLPFPDRTFDVVTFWEVLHHLDDVAAAVREGARVSRKYLIVFEPNPMNPAVALLAVVVPDHVQVLSNSLRHFQDLLKDAGCSIIQAFRGGWIFPNATPRYLLPVLKYLPYRWILGISLVVIAERPNSQRGRATT